MFRKSVSMTIASLVMCFLMMSNAFAAVLGSIPYWEADYSQIGRWSSARTTYNTILGWNTSFDSADFASYVKHGRDAWTNSGIAVGTASSESSATINFYGGDFAALSLANANIQSWMAGYTEITTKSYEGDWSYLGAPKTGYLYSKAKCYVIYSSGRTAAQYKNVATHELGHALGWVGHASGSSNVMYATMNGVTTLTTIDKRHIGQIY